MAKLKRLSLLRVSPYQRPCHVPRWKLSNNWKEEHLDVRPLGNSWCFWHGFGNLCSSEASGRCRTRALPQVVVKCKCQSLEEPLQVVQSPTLGNKKCTFQYNKHYTDQSRLCLIFLCHEYPLNEDSKCVSCFLVGQFNAEISDFKNGKKW